MNLSINKKTSTCSVLLALTLIVGMGLGCGNNGQPLFGDMGLGMGGSGGGGFNPNPGGSPTPSPTPHTPPKCNDDTYKGLGNTPIHIDAAHGVLVNDTGGNLTVKTFQNPSVSNAVVNVAADGSFTYTPPAGFTGHDTFTYTGQNSFGTSTATVNINCDTTDVTWFVDNTKPAPGQGTFDNPFPTLVQAQNASSAGQFIYVFKGDGTSKGLNKGITLKDGQRLIGQGIDFTFDTGQGGIITIVAKSSAPILTNQSADPVVALADSDEVGGITTNGGSFGMTGCNCAGFNIHDNTVQNAYRDGIYLTDCTGTGAVTTNVVTANGFHADGAPADCGGDGICIVNGNQTTLTTTVTGNHGSANFAQAFEVYGLDQSNLHHTVTGNIFNTRTKQECGGTVVEAIAFNFEDSSVGSLNIANNTTTICANESVDVDLSGYSQVTATINDNSIDNCGQFGMDLVAWDHGQGTFQVASNQVNHSAVHGIEVASLNSGKLRASLSLNNVKNSQGAGIHLSANSTSELKALVSRNTLVTNNLASETWGFRADSVSHALMCLLLTTNASDTGYRLFESAPAVFDAEDTLASDTGGPLVKAGTITTLAAGACGF